MQRGLDCTVLSPCTDSGQHAHGMSPSVLYVYYSMHGSCFIMHTPSKFSEIVPLSCHQTLFDHFLYALTQLSP